MNSGALNRWLGVTAALVVCSGLSPVQAVAGGDPVRGRAIYESRCTACHSLDQSRIGPAHRGVFGRRAASVAYFQYSPALRKSTIVWTAKALDRWLKDPEKLVPGQKMGFMVSDPRDRSDVIAFLMSADAR